jgi:hypothetical protein
MEFTRPEAAVLCLWQDVSVSEDLQAVEESRYDRCLAFVASAHHGQTDKAGRPYIEHLLDVSGRAAKFGPDARVAGLLHDLLEDTKTTPEELRGLEVSDAVIDAVETVTRRRDESYGQFIDRVVDRGGLALIIKRADLESNLGRLASIPDKTLRQRLQAKYEPALAKVKTGSAADEQTRDRAESSPRHCQPPLK